MMMETSNLKVANALLLIFNQNNKRPSEIDIYNRCLTKKHKTQRLMVTSRASPLSPYNRGSFIHGIADDISMTFVRAATIDPGTFCSTKTLFSLHNQGRVQEKKLYDRFAAERAIKVARKAAEEEVERKLRKERAEEARKEALVQKLKEREERRIIRAEARRVAEMEEMAAEEQRVYDAEAYLIATEKQAKLEEELRIKREEEERIREAEEKAERARVQQEYERMEKERERQEAEATRQKKKAEEARLKKEEEQRVRKAATAARKKKEQEERNRKAAAEKLVKEEEEERERKAEEEAQLKREEEARVRKATKEARRAKLAEEALIRKAAKEARTKELEQQAVAAEERRAARFSGELKEKARIEREQAKAKREEAASAKAAEEALKAEKEKKQKEEAAAQVKKEKEEQKQAHKQAKLAAKAAAKAAAAMLQTTPKKKRGRPSKKHLKPAVVDSSTLHIANLSGSPSSTNAVPTSERSTVVSGDHIMFKFVSDDCWQVGIVRHACKKSTAKQAKKVRKTSRPKSSDQHHWFNVFFAHNQSMLVLHLTPDGKGSDWLFVQDVSPVAWRTALKVGDSLEMLDKMTQSQWVPGKVLDVDHAPGTQVMTLREDTSGAVTETHVQNGCNFAPPHTFIALAHVEDDHHSLCTQCGIGGDVLLCDSPGCPAVWHTHCAELGEIPEGDFICPLHK